MAVKRLIIDGYGQIELNNVAFRRDGRIEAQCHPDAEDFAEVFVENGMLLAVDNIARVVKFVSADEEFPIALVYSAEHMYDERTPGLKNFKLNGKEDFLPRLGYLAIGDKFITNCLCADDAEFADVAALKEAYNGEGRLYGGVSEMGAIKVSATKPEAGPVLLAVRGTGAGTMPDGQFGMKFQVLSV